MAALPKSTIRGDLAWDFNLALRDGLEEVIRDGFKEVGRDTAANVLYQTGVDYAHVEQAFDKAVRAAAAGAPVAVIGQHFAEYIRIASEHYLDITVDCVQDREWGRSVSFEPRKEVAA